jgi:hypothetical protein
MGYRKAATSLFAACFTSQFGEVAEKGDRAISVRFDYRTW